MNNLVRNSTCYLGALVLLAASAQSVAAEDSDFKLSMGVEFTSGEYGGTETIEDTYVPITGVYETGPWAFRLTVPYLSVNAPTGTVILGPDGEPAMTGVGPTMTESGLGDVIAGVTYFDLYSNRDLGLALDLTGKVKFGTADEDKGLGTGETDYSVQADLYKFFDEFTALGSVGYKFRGDPPQLELENAWFASIGGVYRFSSQTRGGLVFDYRESSFVVGDSVQELTAFVSRKLSNDWRIQGYVLTGFSDASPDWGAGVVFKVSL